MNKLKMNNKGQGGIFNTLIILGLVLLAWEFGGDYFGIATPSSFLSEEIDETEIYFTYNLETSGAVPDYYENPQDWLDDTVYPLSMPSGMESYFEIYNVDGNGNLDPLSLVVKTNAPSKVIGNKWHVEVKSEQHLFGSNVKETPIDEYLTFGSGEKIFAHDIDTDNAQVYGVFDEWTEYVITLYDPNGVIFETYTIALV